MAQRKIILRAIFFSFLPVYTCPCPHYLPLGLEDDFRTAHRFIMHICVRNYCMHNKYMGLYRNLTTLATCSRIGMSYRGQENNNFECSLITAYLVHKVLKFLVCVTHDIMTWLGIFTAANTLSLSVQGYTVTNTYLIRVRDCKWRNCIKIY